MRSHVVRIVLGCCLGLFASTTFADDKLENPNATASAPSDAPVAAPATDAAAPDTAPNATDAAKSDAAKSDAAKSDAAKSDAAKSPAPAPIAKAEAKPDPLANLPKTCAPLAKRLTLSNRDQAMAARISLARCIADANLKPLQLLDTQESMLEVEAAIAPAFLLLDDVIARADAQNQLLAHHAKMVIVQQASTRMLASVPVAAQPTVEAARLRDSRRALVEVMLAPWSAQIADEARAANAIATANPKLEKNGSVAIALRDTKKAVPDAIATAKRAPAAPSNAPPAASQADAAQGTLR
jgi:hypothetical protein